MNLIIVYTQQQFIYKTVIGRLLRIKSSNETKMSSWQHRQRTIFCRNVPGSLSASQRGTLNLREWTKQEWTIQHHIAGMEFVGVDKSARCGKGGRCRSGQCGTVWQGWTMREWTMQEWSNACEKCAQDKLKVTDCTWDQLTCDINSQ